MTNVCCFFTMATSPAPVEVVKRKEVNARACAGNSTLNNGFF